MADDFTRADWEAFVGTQDNDWHGVEDRVLALAVELARLFQPEPITAERVSYFIDDAESVSRDVGEGPWVIKKSFMPNARFMWLVLINDVLCGLEDSEGAELDVLGKLPIEWETII